MAKRLKTVDDILKSTNEIIDVKKIFTDVLTGSAAEKYSDVLVRLVKYGINYNPEIFTKIHIDKSNTAEEQLKEYFTEWTGKYYSEKQNSALHGALKTYAEKDSALVARVQSTLEGSYSKDRIKEKAEDYFTGHALYMSAENKNGLILEEYLATVLEPLGWIWCAGSVYRAIDFCYIDTDSEGDNSILLQIKNKYNTENSSSSYIRNDTTIKKWNRLKRPRSSAPTTPIPNWENLVEIIEEKTNINEHTKSQLTEQKYLEYIAENSSKEIKTLDN